VSKSVAERFFIIEGEHAAPLVAETVQRLKEARDAAKAFAEKHGAETVFQSSRTGAATGLGFTTTGEREGLRLDPTWSTDGFYRYVPHRARKKGKEIAAEMEAVPAFDASTHLVSKLKASRMITGDYVSGGGVRVHESVAGICDEAIVLRVPVREDKPFNAPAHFREIRESEFIAITKEGAKP